MADDSYRSIHYLESRILIEGKMGSPEIESGLPAEISKRYTTVVNNFVKLNSQALVVIRDEKNNLIKSVLVVPDNKQQPEGRTRKFRK